MNRFVIATLLIIAFFSGFPAIADDKLDQIAFPAPVLGEKPLKEQVSLAIATYKLMEESDLWNIETFRTGHYKVINDCPDTPWAIESCWRLSNLLLSGSGKVDQAEIIRLMEHALDKYPGNPWQERFKNRLLVTLQDSGDTKTLLYWCQKLLETADPESEQYLSLALLAGKAALANNEHESADWYFHEILNRSQNQDGVFARIARNYISK